MYLTRKQFQLIIYGTLLLSSLIHRDVTLILSAVWLSWTFGQINPEKRDLIITQVINVFIATSIGLYISYKWTIFHWLGLK